MPGKGNPSLSLPLGDGVRRFWKTAICEAATGNPDLLWKDRHEPEESGAADCTEVPFLVLVLRRVMKRIDVGLTRSPGNRSSIKVGRNSERAAGSALAVRAMANAMHGGQCIHSNRSLPAGTSCCHWGSFNI